MRCDAPSRSQPVLRPRPEPAPVRSGRKPIPSRPRDLDLAVEKAELTCYSRLPQRTLSDTEYSCDTPIWFGLERESSKYGAVQGISAIPTGWKGTHMGW